MTPNLAFITTRAEGAEVLADLEAELDTYTHRTDNLGFADRQATRSSADVSGQMAGVNADIAGITATLAVAGITPAMRRTNESKLRRANDRKDNLTDRSSARTGAVAYLADVDTAQIERQVAVLTEAQTAVTAHVATLPA